MDWTQTIAIIVSIISIMGTLVFSLVSMIREDINKMDERWKWLYEKLDAKIDRVKDSTMGSAQEKQ